MGHYPGIHYEIRRMNALVSRLHDFIQLYGYETIETPIIEDANLFLTKAGDQIVRKLFTFERYGRELALRPEFTAAAAYQYAQAKSAVVRWQFSGSVFEDNPQDDTHTYQSYSVGAELIGMAGPIADAEILNLAIGCMEVLDIRDWTLVIGHAGLSRRLLHAFGLDARTERFLMQHMGQLRDHGLEYVLQRLDEWLPASERVDQSRTDDQTAISTQQMLDVLLDATQRGRAMGGRTRHDIAQRLLQKRQRASERIQIIAALEFLQKWSAIAAPPEAASTQIELLLEANGGSTHDLWPELLMTLDQLELAKDDARIMLQPDLARNWDYYTGIVFELRSATGALLAGGGRYDELVGLLGDGQSTPAVGLAFYLDPIMQCVEVGRVQNPLPRVRIAASTPNDLLRAWASTLRACQVIVVVLPGEEDANVRIDAHGLHFQDRVYTLNNIDTFIQDFGSHDQ